MSVNPVFPVTFNGGQMTDLPEFTGTLNGEELIEIVAAAAGADLEAEGVNYSIPSQLLANLLVQLTLTAVIITDGQYDTPGDPYVVQSTDGRIYINKSVAEPTYIEMPLASTMIVEPLVRDVAGTVNDTTAIVTTTFTGGEFADDNYTTVQITSPWGGYFFRPITAMARWALGTA